MLLHNSLNVHVTDTLCKHAIWLRSVYGDILKDSHNNFGLYLTHPTHPTQPSAISENIYIVRNKLNEINCVHWRSLQV